MRQLVLSGMFLCCLGGALTTVAEARTHVVTVGETVVSVAQHEGVSPDELARRNQLEGDPNAPLPVGSVLSIDADDTASAAAQPVPPRPVVSEAARQQLQAEIAASNPTENADVAMWTPSSAESAIAKVLPGAVVGGERTTADAPPAAGSPVSRFADRLMARTSALIAHLTRSATRFIGTPYVFGGTSTRGFDCSGYVQHVFAMFGIHLPRTADAQYAAGHGVHGKMRPGDLVFFQTYEPGPSHVGIYMGHGKFIHSSSHGVMVSHLRERYWAVRYLGVKRVVN